MTRPTLALLPIESDTIVEHTADHIITRFTSQKARLTANNTIKVESTGYLLRTDKRKPERLGLMMVGWGGNNGSTLTAALLANRQQQRWKTRRGEQEANFYGSLVMASTVPVAFSGDREITVPMFDLAPFVHPDDIVVGGWDISGMDLGAALDRVQVLEPDLVRQLQPQMAALRPLPSIYSPGWIASNQAGRADNLLPGPLRDQLAAIRQHIRDFKQTHGLAKVVVLWTANTERFTQLDEAVHVHPLDLLAAIEAGHPEVSPSTVFAVASILEDCPFINGSPQNTLLPAVRLLASDRGVPVGGDDFKTGQTKLKSVLVDFLIQSGIKPLSIVSYNHLGNNDGRNLAEKPQFRSKEASKRGVVEDMVASNPILYPPSPPEGGSGKGHPGPDHVVVIEYVPAVGDSKRALDEYENEIFMGGRNTIAIHNTCEDSLLAAPVMLDLVLLMELFQRIHVARRVSPVSFEPLYPVMGLLSFLLKAPLVPPHAPVVNALMRQRRAIETLLKVCAGLPPTDDLMIEHRLW